MSDIDGLLELALRRWRKILLKAILLLRSGEVVQSSLAAQGRQSGFLARKLDLVRRNYVVLLHLLLLLQEPSPVRDNIFDDLVILAIVDRRKNACRVFTKTGCDRALLKIKCIFLVRWWSNRDLLHFRVLPNHGVFDLLKLDFVIFIFFLEASLITVPIIIIVFANLLVESCRWGSWVILLVDQLLLGFLHKCTWRHKVVVKLLNCRARVVSCY